MQGITKCQLPQEDFSDHTGAINNIFFLFELLLTVLLISFNHTNHIVKFIITTCRYLQNLTGHNSPSILIVLFDPATLHFVHLFKYLLNK